MVYWKDMLKNDQGDAPMRAFDTTIEGNAYIRGLVDCIVTYASDKEEDTLMKEFYIKENTEDAKQVKS